MIQPHGGMPEESDVGGGVPWPIDAEALGTGVDDSAVGLWVEGSGVGDSDDSVGVGDSLVGSGVADDDVGFGAAEDEVGFGVAEVVDGVGDADSASLVLSVGSGDADSVGVSVGGGVVRVGRLGSERDGVGRVGRSLGSEMPPLPQPLTSPTTRIIPTHLERMAARYASSAQPHAGTC